MKKLFVGLMLIFDSCTCLGVADEPAKPSGDMNIELQMQGRKKLNPEISDPVLGDQAQIIEWAWSPKYAKRFGVDSHSAELSSGGLWLIGIKVRRVQYKAVQRYTCTIVGLIDNKLPILGPAEDIHIIHPDYIWLGGMPGIKQDKALSTPEQGSFAPAVAVWSKKPKKVKGIALPVKGLGFPYTYFYRHFQSDLAYFEWDAGCDSFGNPDDFKNQIRFPTKIDGKNDSDKQTQAVFEPTAIAFDIPEGLMRRIYPLLVDADDWSSCMLRRVQGKGALLSLHAIKTKRFGNSCELTQIN